MLFIPLLRKEIHWSKRNLLVLGFLLIIVPASFGMSSVAFQETVPENVPVGTMAQDENVTDQDLSAVEAILNLYTNPTRIDDHPDYESNREDAMRMLEREEIYAIIEVPPNIREGDEDTEETFRFVIDGNIAPLMEAAPFIEELVEGRLAEDRDTIEGNFTVENEIVGLDHVEEERSLAEYLYPTFMMMVLMFFAFTYAPYNLARDANVLDRLRVETTLESLIASKIVYLTALMVVPLVVFGAVALWFGYAISTLAPIPLLIMLLTFSFLTTIAMSIMVLSRFSGTGQFVNLLLMIGVIGASAIDFPRGVASSLRPLIAEWLPTHYAMIAARSLMIKDLPASLYWDMIALLVVFQVLAIIGLKASIIYFRRTT